jgi:two-component sensor histidine kinase
MFQKHCFSDDPATPRRKKCGPGAIWRNPLRGLGCIIAARAGAGNYADAGDSIDPLAHPGAPAPPAARAADMDLPIISLVPEKRYPMVVRYGAALLFVVVSFVVVLTWQRQLQRYPFPVFIPAIFFASLVFERSSGVLATFAAAALATYFFLQPVHSFAMAETDTVSVAAFLLVGIVLSTVTDRLRRTVQDLRRSDAEKSLMLEEAGHRVRNDLMMVSSVLSLQARGQADPAVRAALESAVARVAVIANAQDRIRTSDNREGTVDLSEYLQSLCGQLGDMLRDIRPIAVRVHAPAVTVKPAHAVHIGLMVNELVTNAFKYAFPAGQGGTVQVEVTRGPGTLDITVSDDGVGCPDLTEGGTGSRLVRLLAANLGGTIERIAVDRGCCMHVAIPIERTQPP